MEALLRARLGTCLLLPRNGVLVSRFPHLGCLHFPCPVHAQRFTEVSQETSVSGLGFTFYLFIYLLCFVAFRLQKEKHRSSVQT